VAVAVAAIPSSVIPVEAAAAADLTDRLQHTVWEHRAKEMMAVLVTQAVLAAAVR
jgi:hypothetical protein